MPRHLRSWTSLIIFVHVKKIKIKTKKPSFPIPLFVLFRTHHKKYPRNLEDAFVGDFDSKVLVHMNNNNSNRKDLDYLLRNQI